MQKGIIKEVREIASEGKKTFYEVILQDGSKATTFDAKIKQADAGDTLEFEVAVAGKYINLKDGWKLTKQTSSADGEPSGNGSQMSKEDWAEKQRVERASIENQVRAKLIVELRIAGIFDDKHNLYQKCLGWLGKLDAKPPQKQEDAQLLEPSAEVALGAQLGIASPDILHPDKSIAEDLKQELYDWVATNMGWKDTKSVTTWLVNVCKIPEDKIKENPEWVKQEVALFQGWTV